MENRRYGISFESTRQFLIDSLYVKLGKSHNFVGALGFNSQENEIFSSYMRAYLTLGDKPEDTDDLKAPETDILRKMPVFNRLVAFIEDRENEKSRIARKLFKRGEDLSISYSSELLYRPAVLRNMANLFAATFRKNEKSDSKTQKEAMEKLLTRLKLNNPR